VTVESGDYVWHRLDGSRYGFSSAGKLTWIDDEKGNELTLACDAEGMLVTVTDSAGGRGLTFTRVNGLLDQISGPVTAAVSNGVWVSYGYDANQNLTSITYADGSGFAYSYTDSNDVHNLTEKRNAANHLLATWAYDTQDRCNDNYSVNGRGTTISYVSDTKADVTDAYGTVRTYTLGAINGKKRVTAMTGLAAAPYDGSNLVRWQYDALSNLIEVETAAGTIHQCQNHDARGNPATVILADSEPEERTISYTYHPVMNVALTRSEPSVLGTGNKITTWDYDDDYNTTANENPTHLLSRIIEQGFTKDATGATVAYEYITTLTYNAKGQLLTVDGPLAGTADTTQFGYDAVSGNLLTIARPLVGSTSFADYDAAGQAGRVTAVNSQAETFTYDGRGRVTGVTHEADTSNRSLAFNTAGLPDTATDEDGVAKSYDYDDINGRLYRLYDADSNYVEYLYDTQGNLIERGTYDAGDARTARKRWNYQHPNLPGKLYQEIKADDDYAQYGYDAGSFGIGRRTGMTDPSGSTAFGYDSRGRLNSKTAAVNAVDYVISRTFTAGRRLTSFSYPSGRTIDYTRYASGRIQTAATTFNLSTVNLVNNLSYNPFGTAKGLGTGSGGTVSNTTNQSGDLEIINAGEQMEQVYTYDGNRNLLSVLAANTPWYDRDFDYDALNRLTSAEGIFGIIDFTWDNVGNRLTRTVDSQTDTYTYQPGTGRLAQITGTNPATFSYDANGNITDIDSRTYVYNQNNRLIRVEEGLDILGEYTYNGLGQRQIKQVDGVTTVFHYDFDGNIIAESQADGTMTVEYLHVDQSRMAMVDVATGTLYYFHNNYLGTPVLMTDSTGTVVWEGDYKPFGEAGVHPASAVVNNFRFAGQYYDEETGLHYNYHRYYDPKTGRYLTPDPIGLAGGINPYVYTENNPINLIDPEGLIAFKIVKLTKKLWRKVMPGHPPYKRLRVKVYGDEKATKDLKTKIFPDGRVKSKIGLKVPKSAIEKAKDALKVGIVFIAELLDPFDAISGEMARDEDYLIQYYQTEEDHCNQ
jgi:RHS repeat-associated protein